VPGRRGCYYYGVTVTEGGGRTWTWGSSGSPTTT
jgi:hypothetical protein